MAKKKFYVVWQGLKPGVYASWEECLLQTKGVAGTIYKSFESEEEARRAYASSPYDYIGQKARKPAGALPARVNADSLAVDAACSGNPGPMEYRGVHLRTGKEVFHYGPVLGTNNIGEFLAIVHGLALLKQKGVSMPVYSDSRTAIGWVKGKCCKTKLPREEATEKLFQLIERAEKWLKENEYSTPLIKWDTQEWGEIPADFGRK